mgnify:CR=1 FL=1
MQDICKITQQEDLMYLRGSFIKSLTEWAIALANEGKDKPFQLKSLLERLKEPTTGPYLNFTSNKDQMYLWKWKVDYVRGKRVLFNSMDTIKLLNNMLNKHFDLTYLKKLGIVKAIIPLHNFYELYENPIKPW